jgi:hypothetical protein
MDEEVVVEAESISPFIVEFPFDWVICHPLPGSILYSVNWIGIEEEKGKSGESAFNEWIANSEIN